MSLFKKFFLLIITILMASCNVPTQENFNKHFSALRGSHIDTIIPQWGPPVAQYTYKDGRKAYKWHNVSTDYYDEYSAYPGPAVSAFNHWPSASARMMSYDMNYGYPFVGGYQNFVVHRPMTLEHHCTLIVNTDTNGIIQSHQAIGDNCVAY